MRYGHGNGPCVRRRQQDDSQRQQRQYVLLPQLEAIGAFALTEPTHGSDSVALETTARRDGDGWVLDGAKRWIGNGSIADVVVVWARSAEDGQVKGFLVEKDTPGFTATTMEGKGASRAIWQAAISLDEVRVDEDARLPGAQSFKDTGRVLITTRTTCAWGALGHAVAAYDAALAYSTQRHQFGKPLCAFQIVQERLVRMLAEVTSMQLVLHAAGATGGRRPSEPTRSPAWPSSTTPARPGR